MSLLEVRGLRIAFEASLVMENVNLTADAGELIAIETGVLDGGTSLLKALGGMLRGCEGSVTYRGRELLDGGAPDVLASIGFVYEQRGLISLYSVLRNISLPLHFHSTLDHGEIRARAEEVCDRLGIDRAVLAMHPHDLNDVQTRLINLARALVNQPGLVLIDELEGGMSEELVVDTMTRIRHYMEAHPMAVIMTTSSDLVLEQADRVYAIDRCRLLERAI